MRVFSHTLVFIGLGFPNVLDAGPVTCIFSKECFEDEACIATEFKLLIDSPQDDPDGLNLITDSETLPVEIISVVDRVRIQLLAKSESAVHLLSWKFRKGYTRYTVHMQGPLAVTYHGVCAAAP